MAKKPLSRRAMLRGVGGFLIGLPFLEAMVPRLAYAHAAVPKRFVTAFCGTVVGADPVSNPGAYGALPATMPASWAGLASVRQHVSILSNLNIPVYNNGTTPPGPASSYNKQHGTTPAPMLAGVTSLDTMPVMVGGQTADQHAAAGLGAGGKLDSLQIRTQLFPYTGSNNNNNGTMSAKLKNGQLFALPPIASPAQLFSVLFGSGGGGGGGGGSTPLGATSVLDLIADDAQRLTSAVSASDKIRLDEHFEEIRALERSMVAATGGGGGGGGSCASVTAPVDPAPGTNAFSGWSNETLRGQMMADMLAYALSCDLTRVASWMLTFEQVQMGNAIDRLTQMHDDSHNAGTRQSYIAANCDWHATLFARLVAKLASLPEAGGTVLDSTFLSLLYAESKNAHGRSGMRQVIAGMPSRIKVGQHIDALGGHPGTIQIAGLQAVGLATNTLGELSGALSPMLK